MPRTIELSTFLSADPDLVWSHVRTSRLLNYVTNPLIVFRPRKSCGFPAEWTEGDYQAEMRLFGFIPVGQQTIGIRYPAAPVGNTRILRDKGHGTSARVWDHYIVVEPEGESGTRYTDRVTVDAGWHTPFVAAFAYVFYAHRQRRWRKLVRSGFADLHGTAKKEGKPG